jgi:hypothetical protein
VLAVRAPRYAAGIGGGRGGSSVDRRVEERMKRDDDGSFVLKARVLVGMRE